MTPVRDSKRVAPTRHYRRSIPPYHVLLQWITRYQNNDNYHTVRSLHDLLLLGSNTLRSQPDSKTRRYDRQLRYASPA